MGGTVSTKRLVSNVTQYVTGTKRKYSECEEEDATKVIDLAMHTPKRKKLVSTAQYIYQALYQEGKNSDVTVRALGEDFNLHKVYLCQSPYFASMFGGSWLETTKKFVSIDIIDDLISVNSLKTVFGSLYYDEITLNPMEIVATLATATMFQLDGIIDKCTEVMMETINPKTALDYYDAACRYGDKKLKESCIQWFHVNLMTYFYSSPIMNLKIIPIPLMAKLVSSPDLFVMQTEFSIYVMLKYWMYLHIFNPEEEPNTKDINLFYCNREDSTPFLFTIQGARFVCAFKGIRLHNLISHHMDVELILRDNIIPRSWLYPVVLQQWKVMLRINQNEDKGPTDVTDEKFLATSLRCGRILSSKERHIWRWTGFHYGMDLLMIIEGSKLSVKRNHRSEFEQLLSLQTIRHISIRVTVATLNEQRQVVYSKSSEVKKLTLVKGQDTVLLNFEPDLTYPLIISANILYTSADFQEAAQEEFVQSIT